MDWQNTTFWPTFRPLFWNLVRTPPDQREADAMEESRLKTAEILGYLDAHLKNRTYIADLEKDYKRHNGKLDWVDVKDATRNAWNRVDTRARDATRN